MIEQHHGDIRLLHFEGLSREPRLVHAVTTRPQNLAPHRGADCERAVEWRKRICEILGVSFDNLTSPSQVHAGDSLTIEPDDIGRGRHGRDDAVPYVDGLLTNRVNVPIIILSADCPIVVTYDPVQKAVGAVHASWRGTVAGAASQLVRMMRGSFDSKPGDLMAGICPSAGPDRYEVGEIVRRVARHRLTDGDACFCEREGRLYLDLWAANRQQLIEQGVDPARIETSGLCSITDERFWSHRRDGESAGRFALIAGLR